MEQAKPPKPEAVREMVARAIADASVTDIHTHIYTPAFGPLLLSGIDELLTYHYLVAETMRWSSVPVMDFWRLSKRGQADVVWQTLFAEHSPCSEACRGVLTALSGLGLDVSCPDLAGYRAFFEKQSVEEQIDRVFEAAGLTSVVMTNDPFDEAERPVWLAGAARDPRFHAALRLDVLLNSWEAAVPMLRGWGCQVDEGLGGRTAVEVRRFLVEWIERIEAVYMAVSLPPTFDFPGNSARCRLLDECVLPAARDTKTPLALMIGVRRAVNPDLGVGGDAVSPGRIEAVERLCAAHPDCKFLVTMLSRENQHELCVAARKFRNLMPFGCWWFLNNPSLIEEITRMRFELLGTSFVPQHSDARVLEQVVYKWAHSRPIIARVMADKYADMAATGWNVTESDIRRDVAELFGGAFWSFVGK